MKTRITFILIVVLSGIVNILSAQTASLTFTNTDESDVRNGLSEIVVTLVGDTIIATVGSSNSDAQTFLSGMIGGGSVEWDNLIVGMNNSHIALSAAGTIATISIPTSDAYYITENDSITFNIPLGSLKVGAADIPIAEKIVVLNEDTYVVDGGDLGMGINESLIRSDNRTYVLTLTNNLWISTVAANLTPVKSMFSSEPKFDDLVSAIVADDIILSTDEKTLTITFNKKTDYYIASDESIAVTVPSSLLQFAETPFLEPTFTINNEEPTISITIETIDETLIRSGDRTFEIILDGDVWPSTVSATLKNGIIGGANWNADIRDRLGFFSSINVLTVTIPATPSFNVDADEIVTVKIALNDLPNSDGDSISASNSKTIQAADVTFSATSTFDNANESDLRIGDREIVLTLTEDTWVSGVDNDPIINAELINGLSFSAQSDATDSIRVAILDTDQGLNNTSVAGNVVTFKVPAMPGFDITSNTDLSINVPVSATTNSASVLSENNFATVTSLSASLSIESVPSGSISEADLNGSRLRLTLLEDKFVASPQATDFTFQWDGTGSGLSAGTLNRISNTVLEIDLIFIGDLDDDDSFSVTIDQAALLGSLDLLSTGSKIDVLGIVEPTITGVSIPNEGMGIGENVTAVISVEDDNGQPFSFEGGTIAGRALSEAVPFRIDKYTYELTFNIGSEGTQQYEASDNIPYTNLQFSNDGTMGLIDSGVVDGPADKDTIDTERPEVTLISYNGGNYKAGETLTAVLNAGEEDLTFIPTETLINGYNLTSTNVWIAPGGSGLYYLNYTLNPDDAETVPIPTSVKVKDIVGNESAVFSAVTGTNPVIDASTPTISAIVVTSTGDKIPGDIVELNVTASEQNLVLAEGSKVNGVPMGSLNFTDNLDQTYTISYTISQGDDEVVSGALTATIVLEDLGGNQVSSSSIVSGDVAIFTEVPTAFIHGTTAVCAGESATIYVSNSGGVPPYDVEVISTPGGTEIYSAIDTVFSFDVTPSAYTEYSISSVEDSKGVDGNGLGLASLTVNPIIVPTITAPTQVEFPIGGSPVTLTGSPNGGVFNGPGVESSENLFHPAVADTGVHTIVYTYTHPPTACVGSVEKVITVVEEQANLYINESVEDNQIICFNEENVVIKGQNLSYAYPAPGNFSCNYMEEDRDISSDEGFFDPNIMDDLAYLIPELMPAGRYRLTYNYLFNGDQLQKVQKEFTVKRIEDIEFTKFTDDKICSNAGMKNLGATYDELSDDFEFLGNGVFGSPAAGFEFRPENGMGVNTIVYNYTSPDGCSVSKSRSILVYDVPTVDFKLESGSDTSCIPKEGGEVIFLNTTDSISLINSWTWNFDDLSSGEDNIIEDTIYHSNVAHNFLESTEYRVSLETSTTLGNCAARKEIDIVLADIPVTNFRWKSDCWKAGNAVDFVNESSNTDVGDWESFTWRIYDKGMDLKDTIFINSIVTAATANTAYTFPSQDDYYIELEYKTTMACSSILKEKLVLKPTLTFGEDDIELTDFNDNDGKWSARMANSESDTNSWGYGKVDFGTYEAEDGDFSWYTDLNKGNAERSWIQSPCFDFSNAERPMIRMDVLKSFDNNRDGAVLQYTLDNGVNWVTIGNIDEGIEWYNSFEIKGKPGGGDDSSNGSPIGWSGESPFNPDPTWVSVAHDLDALVGEDLVIFGIFYATDGGSVEDNEGFAVDNIYIGERAKRALVEHFTNASDPASLNADIEVNDFVAADSLDVTSIQYHMNYPGDDPMNENNPSPAAARSFYYGINQVPYALIDGGVKSDYMYDFNPSIPTAEHLKQLTLESPLFSIDLDCLKGDNLLRADVELLALREIDSSDLLLFVAVVEKNVATYEQFKDIRFKNVVLDLLPNAAGYSITPDLWETNSLDVSFSWTFANVNSGDELMLVAFLQERESGKILQVATADYLTPTSGLETRELDKIHIYPNPVSNRLYIENTNSADAEGIVEILDMTGRVLMQQKFASGGDRIVVNTAALSSGNYIVNLRQNGIVTARSKFIKLR